MKSLKNMSIKNKLIGIILAVVLLAVGSGFTIVTAINIKTLRQEMVNNMLMNATLISDHCVVPLTFENDKAVAKALQPLRLIPFVENGYVYDTSGTILAAYDRNEKITDLPDLNGDSRWYFESDFLHVIQPIVYNNRELGKMHLRATTESLSHKINIYFITMLGIGLGLIVISYFIALRLQSVISKPILNLAAVTRDISRLGDYSVRVPLQRSDEVGELYTGFNNMLDQINKREFERDVAEKAMRQSEKKHRELTENLPQRIFQKDDNLIYISCNMHYAQDLGIKPEEIAGKTDFDFYPKELAEKYREDDRRILESGKTEEIEETYIKDDQEFIVQTVKTPQTDHTGKIIGILGIFWDITERKQTEKELRLSEERFRGLAEMLPEAVFETDQDLIITFANKRASELFGYSAEDLKLGLSGLEVLAPDDRERAKANLGRRQIGEDPGTLEYQAQRKDGSTFPVLFHANSIMKDGKLIGIRGIIVDITETKRLQELESRAARLEMAGTIAGQVAHDFNNLLAPMIAYPEFIRDEVPHNNKIGKYLDSIENAANKMTEINQDLLTMGRRGHFNLDVIDLNQIVNQAVLEAGSRSKTMTVETDLCKDILMIKGGAAQIHRMLTNLMVNAQDATQNAGQITIRTENYYANDTSVTFNRVPMGEYVKLTISDNGCGIPDEISRKILDPFFSTKRADMSRGSGLGLSVVDAVIKDHNGFLDMSSKVGQGTSFYLFFPITREDMKEDDSKPLSIGNERILIVDDDEIQREVSLNLLKNLGYKLHSVESGEKAIEFLRENPQDLIILDMVMPGGIDGTETYRRMLEISPHQKAIILSGYSESDRIVEAQSLGAGNFVKKPITKEIIATAVRTELDRIMEKTRQ